MTQGSIATLYLDNNGATSGVNSSYSGTWTATGIWNTSNGTGTPGNWVSGSDAVFNQSTTSGITGGSNIVANSLTFNNGASWTFFSGLTITITTGNITINNAPSKATSLSTNTSLKGSNGLSKAGNGTLTFLAAQTYTGNTAITGGILRLGAADRIPDASNLLVNGSDAQFDLQGFSDTVASVTLTNGSITGSGAATLTTTGSFSVANGSITAILADNGGGLLKTGASTSVTLSGANTYSGTTTVRAGTLIADVSDVAGISGAFGSASSDILLTDNSSASTDNASLVIDGAFTVARNITVQNHAASGVTTIGGTNAAATTAVYSGIVTLNKNVTLGAATALAITDFQGQITESGGAFAVSTSGLGIIKLSNATGNLYSNGTTVASGTLLVNNTTGSGTGSGAISVGSGATLGGGGSIVTANNAGVTVADGGKLSSGSGDGTVGTLKMDLGPAGVLDISGAVSTASSSALLFKIGAGTNNSDKIQLSTGTLNIGASVLDLSDFGITVADDVTASTSYVLIDSANPFNVDTANGGMIDLSTVTFDSIYTGHLSLTNSGLGNDLTLTIDSIPEPGSLATVSLAGAYLLKRRRRSIRESH